MPTTASPGEAGAHRSCLTCVRLFATDVFVTSTSGLSCEVEEMRLPLIELTFEYGGTRVRASDERTRVFRSSAGALEAVDRDESAEAAARRVMERLGAVELACTDAIAPPADCEADYVVRADGGEQAFCAFTARSLAQWRALGWHVEVDAEYPFRLVEREPAWVAAVRPSDERPDWFGLEIGVEIDGVRVDLVSLLIDLLDQLDEDDGLGGLAASTRATWALRVSATHHLAVPLDRLRALLRVVAELYQGEHRRLRAFPAVRASALVELESSFRQGGGRIMWADPAGVLDRVRGRAKAAPRSSDLRASGLCATLRPYQAEGVAFLQRLAATGAGGVLADEMGLGKTLQTIAHFCVEKQEGRLDAPALVVAPTTLVGNWSREIARFAPALRVLVLHGPDRRTRWPGVARFDVVITTYPVLVRDEERFAEQRFHVVVLDEAQAIKNARSQARRAIEHVVAQHRVCLTGTPVENHLGELGSIFGWLAPGLLGDELAFRRFWREPIERRGDDERLAALREIIAPYVLRRLKRDVARELPPKTELPCPVELGPKQRELYESIRVAAHADVRKAIRAKGLAASSVTILDALTKLRQVCCDPRLVALDAARAVHDSAKLEALMALVGQQLAGGHRLLVFSQFTSMLSLIASALDTREIPHLLLTGATRDRQRVVDAFEDGRADVFLISLKAGGTGLNLTGADTVVHYEPWWNPASQAQATDRAYRIGQRRPVFVHNLYVAGSVEERVLDLQERKRWLSTALLGDGAAAPPMSEGDVDALFAPLD
ncbi:MAG: DEAD/DEAH box helicase [Myxococcota bacterium]|nr:DEAD/DEAH box helicase [Myxococcota bacterium]